MAARIVFFSILLASPLSALSQDPCAPAVPVVGTTTAPNQKGLVIGASVAGGAAVATGIGLLLGYGANWTNWTSHKDVALPPKPTLAPAPPPPPPPTPPPFRARVVDDEADEAASTSCGNLCWIGLAVLAMCCVAGLGALLVFAFMNGKKRSKAKEHTHIYTPMQPMVEELAPLVPLQPPVTTASYVEVAPPQFAAPISYLAPPDLSAPVMTSTMVAAAPPVYAEPVSYLAPPEYSYAMQAAPAYAVETVAAPAYAMQAAPAYAMQSFAARDGTFGAPAYGMQTSTLPVVMESMASPLPVVMESMAPMYGMSAPGQIV